MVTRGVRDGSEGREREMVMKRDMAVRGERWQ